MKALTQTIIATGRELLLQQHKHSHQMKLAKMNAASPWLSPAVVLTAVTITAVYGPKVYKASRQAIRDYRVKRHINKTMKTA